MLAALLSCLGVGFFGLLVALAFLFRDKLFKGRGGSWLRAPGGSPTSLGNCKSTSDTVGAKLTPFVVSNMPKISAGITAIYFVVPNGTESYQLEWLEHLHSMLRAIYTQAMKTHGPGSSDYYYTSRLSTLLQDDKVSYIASQDFPAAGSSITSLYPAAKFAAKGVKPHPFICMVPWWLAVSRSPPICPQDAHAKDSIIPGNTIFESTYSFATYLFLHEVGHAISGNFGHNQYWLRAWHWVAHVAEEAGVWSYQALKKTWNACCLNFTNINEVGQHYTWDPYPNENIAKVLKAASSQDQRAQIINLWENKLYMRDKLCPTPDKMGCYKG